MGTEETVVTEFRRQSSPDYSFLMATCIGTNLDFIKKHFFLISICVLPLTFYSLERKTLEKVFNQIYSIHLFLKGALLNNR